MTRKIIYGILALLVIASIIATITGPPTSIPQGPQSKAMFQARTIGLALQQYAADHSGKYPEGSTSTEVFQKLLDGKYVTDSTTFYYPLPGKVKPNTATLTPQNVGWDVTCCVDATSPDELPVVFLTGYTVSYQAGARAVPFNQSTPPPIHFSAVCYKDMSARALQNPDPNGSFPDFIPADFNAKGKSYHQLTPEGN